MDSAGVTGIEAFHRMNVLAAFVVGFVINGLLLWLIVARTTRELKTFSRVLLHLVIMEMLFLLASFLIGPVISTQNGNTVIWGVGVIGGIGFSKEINFTLYCLWSGLLSLSQDTFLPLQFIYRWLLVSRNIDLRMSRYLLLALLISIPCPGLMIIEYFANLNSDADLIEAEHLFLADRPTPSILVYNNSSNSLTNWSSLYSLIFLLLTYLGITACTSSIWRQYRSIRGNTSLAQRRIASMNKQIIFVLIAQAVVPLLASIGPSILLAIFSLTSAVKEPFFGSLYTAVVVWIPAISGLMSICIVRPYRMAIIKCTTRVHHQQQSPQLHPSISVLHIQSPS